MADRLGQRRVRSRPEAGVGATEYDFAAHARFRFALRRFERYSEQRAQEAGLTTTQHQLLLAICGSPKGWLTVGEVARALLIQPHSAVGLINRAERDNLLRREQDQGDQRRVRVYVTPTGRAAVAAVTAANRTELMRLWRVIPSPATRSTRSEPGNGQGDGP